MYNEWPTVSEQDLNKVPLSVYKLNFSCFYGTFKAV